MEEEGLLVYRSDRGKIPVGEPRLENSLQARFYLMVLKFIDRDRMLEVQSEHLTWLLEKEKEGVLFLSGPATYLDEGEPVLSGLMAIRAKTEEEARAIAEQEPFVVKGIMEYKLYQWGIFQGAVAVSINLSDGSGSFC
ncbi:MAG: hypothetical protein H6920_04465 [Sphingomonadaceae bacterium]|nr:hypothetical protein [Sphingomonadaceae bacterium]MCP5390864.1 hypothetical protein [Sphingomonadaceae bacterium]MCP5394620.1 hypothetical protein [Sphingomonadaceae bacterium]